MGISLAVSQTEESHSTTSICDEGRPGSQDPKGKSTMKRSSKRLSFAVVALTLLAAGISLHSQAQTQNQPPVPVLTRADEMLQAWNQIGNKLVAMAQDFPEDKYDFKVQKDERTFALNLLHAAALDFVLIRRISGSNLGPDFGEGDNPSRDLFKTKADVVKFVQEAVADGAKVIQQQGDAGLDKTTKFFGGRLAHNSYIWTFAIEHSGEHYGQLVVYYRANDLVPPDSRRNAQASQHSPGAVFRDCPDCPEMVVVPAGDFTMGSSAEEKSWAASHGGSMESVADEAPQHQVSLPSFALGKYDVTRGEYAAFARQSEYPAGDGCGRGSAISKWEKDPKSSWESPGFKQTDRDPVVCVSWQDAKAYVAWLNEKTGHAGAYRLPSESEWEYATRAGTTSKFWWGDDVDGAPSHAWFRDNSGVTGCKGLFCADGQTHPVGAKPPNAFGLYDMAGNVWQWTEDCYDNSYAPAPTDGRANEVPSSDPKAKDGQDNCLRVDRGGSWMFPAWLLRPATRERNPADYRAEIMGFRVAKTLK
jgi:formylglycine-generating enzyme required for sulfatase activity